MLANDLEKRQRTSTLGTGVTPPVSLSLSAAHTEAKMPKRKIIYAEDVVRAKQQLKKKLESPIDSAQLSEDNGEILWGPVVVCESATWYEFARWLDNNEGRLRRWVFEPLEDATGTGRVMIYSLPSAVHSKATSAVTTSILEQIVDAGKNIHLISSLETGQTTCRTGDRGQEPDASFTPVNLRVGGGVMRATGNFPFPNFILEVAYKNEGLRALRAKLLRWMDHRYSSVQVAIGIKIFPGCINSRRVAILHQRGQLVQEVEFGMDQNRPGPVTIAFPLRAIYFGVALPPALAGRENHQIIIDLIALRETITTAVDIELSE